MAHTESHVHPQSCTLNSESEAVAGGCRPAAQATDFKTANPAGNVCKFGGPCRLAKGDAYERLRALVEACPLAIVGLDITGTVEVWNPAAETMFGWKAAEVVGRPLPTVPDDQLDQFHNSQQLVLDGQTIHLPDVVRLRKGGVRLTVNISIAPMFNSEGDVFGMMSVQEESQKKAKTA